MSPSSTLLTAMFAFTGTVHLVKPQVFDPALPEWLPGRKRTWAIGSGLAELGCGVLVALPRTRRLGGYVSAALFVAVFPGNVHMFTHARSARARTLTLLRLPLQAPLVWWAWGIARRR